MNLTHFCTQGVVAASAMAFCFSHAVAQRTDYNYTRPVTPSGIATNDCLVYDFAGNSVSTLRGDKLLECGKQIRDVRINPTGMSLIVLSDDKKARYWRCSEQTISITSSTNSTTRRMGCQPPWPILPTPEPCGLLRRQHCQNLRPQGIHPP